MGKNTLPWGAKNKNLGAATFQKESSSGAITLLSQEMLALALAIVVSGFNVATCLQVEEWFNSNQTLGSEQLIELVPLANDPGYGTDRFNLDHIWRLYNTVSSKKVNGPPEPQFDFEKFVQEHGESPDDLYKYGEMLFYGVGGTPRNLTRAAEFYLKSAESGHPEANFMIGVAYSSGLYGNWPQNQALATLHYTSSAMSYSTRGLLAMGYRYRKGISSPTDYEHAYGYYANAADDCLDYYEDFPYVGNRYEPFLSHVIADEYSYGIYGKLQPRRNLRRTKLRDFLGDFDSVEEGLNYIEFSAFEDGSTSGLRYLATAYQLNIKNGLPDFDVAAEKAEELLSRAKRDNSRDGRSMQSWALCLLGDCYRRGTGRPFDIEKAKELYHQALEVALPAPKNDDLKNCAQCYTGLGLIAIHELLQEPDLNTKRAQDLYLQAKSYFQPGSLLSSPFSQYYLGKEMLELGHTEEARALLSKCDDIIPLASHALGLIYYSKYEATGSVASLKSAVEEMAMTCEQNEELYSPARWAHYAYERDQGAALMGFTVAAELGFTSAVINIADILDVQHSSLSLGWLTKWPVPAFVDEKLRAATALMYYTRAAQHGYSLDSLYKVGDYLYHGLGTAKSIDTAIKIYDALARKYGFPMAYWALGWMHDRGVGMPQDFKQAIQYYTSSLALARTRASYIAIKLSILGLYIRRFIAKWSGVDVGSLSREIPDSKQKKSWIQAIKDARKIIKESQDETTSTTNDGSDGILDQIQDAEFDLEYDNGAILVDISIIVLVATLLVTLIWFRRRR